MAIEELDEKDKLENTSEDEEDLEDNQEEGSESDGDVEDGEEEGATTSVEVEVEDDFEPGTRNYTAPSVTTSKEKDEDDVDLEDEELIDRAVDKKVAPLQSQLRQQQDAADLNAHLQANPEHTKYKKVIQKYMSHPAYQNVPVEGIAAIVTSKDAQALGAAKERAAQKKAKSSKTPGTSVRNTKVSGKKDWSKASKKEFEAQRAKVLGRHGD